ncbi:isoprenylcysteine carboxylmethyltransferase family protein [uncultured Dubosiella sp.]|uniref:isoprenylcysteine carboxylmethyltransferase family protein n=1 Tax=Dubosiella muris TaxID=3038133 RepID=UPI00338F6D85
MVDFAKLGNLIWNPLFLWIVSFDAEVLRENIYLSPIIEGQKNQKVIDAGLYGIVRHPMYMITVFLFLSMLLVLGSSYSFLIFLTYPLILVKRIENKTKIL